ncbi:MAG: ABC transporter permease [Firmicutes bacterium]|nr:ABC transporter permease [Bacillota bacterium]
MIQAETGQSQAGIRWRRLGQWRSVLVAYALVIALFIVGSLTISGFSAGSNVLSMLVLASFTGIAAMAQNLAILLGGIDLSIPYVITMGDILIPYLDGHHWPFVASLVMVLAIAVMVGGANGYLSSTLRLHPLIITLGTGYIVDGAMYVLTQGVPSGSAPRFLVTIASLGSRAFGFEFPPVILIWAVLAAAFIWGLTRTKWGRQIYAVGANAKAAELMLVSRVQVWTYAYIASAVLAALTGVLLSGFSGSGYFGIGNPYLFVSVGAVAIGGTSLLGGVGTYWGTIAGVLALTEISSLLIGFNIGSSRQEIFYGLIVLVMISIYGRELHVKNRL